jgi:uncharacterized protein YsxB (DUF464 family)
MADPAVLRIAVELSPGGLLRKFRARGHAGGAKDGLACALATLLLRTAGRTFEDHRLNFEGEASASGAMSVVLDDDSEWLEGVSDFLLRGLCDLEEEFPGQIVIEWE